MSYIKQALANADENLITEAELLGRIPVSRPTLKKKRDDGTLPYIAFGKRILYDWPTVRQSLLIQQRGGIA
jgi:hypothetical protein